MFTKNLIFSNGSVKMRSDEYAHAYYVKSKGENESLIFNDKRFAFIEENTCIDNVICSNLKIQIKEDVVVEKLYLRTGIDTYMEKYPDWNEQVFPTFLRSEKTHFIGYLQSPNNKVLGIASPNKISTWSLDYCWINYDGEEIVDVGHRIYTACLHFFNNENGVILKAGDIFTYKIYYSLFDGFNGLNEFWQKYALCPLIESDKWTYELGEICSVNSDGVLTIVSPTGKVVKNGDKLVEYGLYEITSQKNDKISTAKIFVRKQFDEYLNFAAKCVFKYPQRPSTHAETCYGYYSGFAYALKNDDKEYKVKLKQDFDDFLSVILNKDKTNLCEEALPQRIQNVSNLISLLVFAYKVYLDNNYLDLACVMAERIIDSQAPTGEYLAHGKHHYTCVIYPAKSMLELCDLLLGMPNYESRRKRYFDSAKRAIADLNIRLDNIGTEGQETFEDGMITCSALQLAFIALKDETIKDEFLNSAQILIKKHACLEQRKVPDTRMRGCTLRFWESMYDVLIHDNMINSPHGWTSWKTYATFYLYLLTGNVEYLKDTMDTLCACLQCFDIDNEKLYWAYIVDPVLHSQVFSCVDGKPILTDTVFGDCYMPMISDKWVSDKSKVCFGYAFPTYNITDGIYYGGCCDNDVHEHIKCLYEVGLNAFVHETDNEVVTYNCTKVDNKICVKSKLFDYLYYYANKDKQIIVNEKAIVVSQGLNKIHV